MFRLEGETALVTGASRGIGKAIALALSNQGAYVVGTATSSGGAAAITTEFATRQISGEGVVLNLETRDQITDIVRTIESNHGSISILINNAGITSDGLTARMVDQQWDSVIEVNLSAAFRLVRACTRGMIRAKKGKIVNVGSVVGSSGNAGQANYAAAKAGLIGFTKSLALELAPRNISCNVVAPGFIETDMTAALSDQQQANLASQIPLSRFGTPAEIASLVVYLVSPEASYITGQVIHINGGLHLSS
ncbi:MAG: 3-oxoacyl-[acyl-carrier-protein] reductase [Acidiferrobacteraceae bacterium]|nr:3-oxoacyl-[acyl-carrier-protein] reductase [Acidiferrobacteraceae bacterium]|tara:strand:+ start:1832 stop:2581 length:750 start_codon:yes stop_codon:yes gene_type:complete